MRFAPCLTLSIAVTTLASFAANAGVPDPATSGCSLPASLPPCPEPVSVLVTLRDAFHSPVVGCSTSCTVVLESGTLDLSSDTYASAVSDGSGIATLAFAGGIGGSGSVGLEVTTHCSGDIALCSASGYVLPECPTSPFRRVESFTSTTYMDASNTTALWDVSNEQLRLDPFELALAGSQDTPGNAFYSALHGNHLLVADQSAGVQLVNIEDPTSPNITWAYLSSGDARNVAVSGDLIFVGDGDSLLVLNIVPNELIFRLGAVAVPDSRARGVAVSGDHVFVADWNAGVHAVDVSDPSNPSIVGSVVTPGSANALVVSGDHVYVADWNSHLRVVDVSDPTAMSVVGGLSLSGSSFDVAVDGNLAYVASGGSGLFVADVSNPSSPTLLGQYDTPGSARGVWAGGDFAYVADAGSGLHAIDVSDPTSPTLLGTYDTPGSARGVVVDGTRAYVTDEAAGVQVIDIAKPLSQPFVGGSVAGQDAYAVAASGDHVYVGEGSTSNPLSVVDVSDPAQPTAVGTWSSGQLSVFVAMEISGDHLYAVDAVASRLYAFDVTNPASPQKVGEHFLHLPDGLAIAGQYAYATKQDTLKVFDIADPTSMVLVDEVPVNGTLELAVAGDHACVSGGDSLHVLDITDPTNLTTVSSTYVGANWAYDVELAGYHAYLVTQEGLEVFDISNPASPVQVATYVNPGIAHDVEISGDLAYLSCSATPVAELQVLDVSDPTSPTFVSSTVVSDDFANDLAIVGDNAYVATDSGLRVIHVRQRAFDDLTRNRGQSVPIDGNSLEVKSVQMVTVQTDSIGWEISANGGADWQVIQPDGGWNTLAVPGSDLVWRSTLEYDGIGSNPTCSSLTITWVPDVAINEIRTDEDGTDNDIYFELAGAPGGSLDRLAYVTVNGFGTVGTVVFLDSYSIASDGLLAIQDGSPFPDCVGYDGAEPFNFSPIGNVTHLVMTSFLGFPSLDLDEDDDGVLDPSIFYGDIVDCVGLLEAWPSGGYLYCGGPWLSGGGAQPAHVFRCEDDWIVGQLSPSCVMDTPGAPNFCAAVGVSGPGVGPLPTVFRLHAPRPNPSSGPTLVDFELPVASNVHLRVYDVTGRLVRVLAESRLEAGRHSVAWDGRDRGGARVSSGVYFYRLETEAFSQTRKAIRLQ